MSLPSGVGRAVEEMTGRVNLSLRDVQAVFREILRLMDDKGCRHTLHRSYGPGGFFCL
ncbi:MAG: hypothetical protein K2L16_07520 [Muribaculaceae bacterium]|nr:hypothetical protein [Muribaculaceae bacterium]